MQTVALGSNQVWIGPIYDVTTLLPASPAPSVPWSSIIVNGVALTKTGNAGTLNAFGSLLLTGPGGTALDTALAAGGTFRLECQLGAGYTPWCETNVQVGPVQVVDPTGSPAGTKANSNAGLPPLQSGTVTAVNAGLTTITTSWTYSSTGPLATGSLPGQAITFTSGALANMSFVIESVSSAAGGKLALTFASALPASPNGASMTLSNLCTATGLAAGLEQVPTLGALIDQTGADGSDGSPIQTKSGAVAASTAPGQCADVVALLAALTAQAPWGLWGGDSTSGTNTASGLLFGITTQWGFAPFANTPMYVSTNSGGLWYLGMDVYGEGVISSTPDMASVLARTVTNPNGNCNLFAARWKYVSDNGIFSLTAQPWPTDAAAALTAYGAATGAEVAAVSPVGPGGKPVVVTVENTSGDPLQGVSVWITSDLAGNTTVAGTLTTNSAGQANFLLPVGPYYVWRLKSGYAFQNPQAIAVS